MLLLVMYSYKCKVVKAGQRGLQPWTALAECDLNHRPDFK